MPITENGDYVAPDAWGDLEAEMRLSLHPCGSHAFCHMVQTWRKEWRRDNIAYPYGRVREFPTPDQPLFINTLKGHGWYKPREYNGGLLGKSTKATNKRTAVAIALAWPLWRDGPRDPESIEDIQVIMYWMEMFRGCAITKGTYSWHRFYVRKVQELLAEHDKVVRSRAFYPY